VAVLVRRQAQVPGHVQAPAPAPTRFYPPTHVSPLPQALTPPPAKPMPPPAQFTSTVIALQAALSARKAAFSAERDARDAAVSAAVILARGATVAAARDAAVTAATSIVAAAVDEERITRACHVNAVFTEIRPEVGAAMDHRESEYRTAIADLKARVSTLEQAATTTTAKPVI